MMRRRLLLSGKKGGISVAGAPNGAYVLRTDNRLYTGDEWQSDWNAEAVGIAVIKDDCRFMISLTAGEDKKWGGYGTAIKGIVTSMDQGVASKDFAGEANTQQMIAQIGGGKTESADYVTAYTFPNGKKGYLGSLGEWLLITEYWDETNDLLWTVTSGSAPLLAMYYRTSTQFDPQNAWCIMPAKEDGVSYYGKNKPQRVRPFGRLD